MPGLKRKEKEMRQIWNLLMVFDHVCGNFDWTDRV